MKLYVSLLRGSALCSFLFAASFLCSGPAFAFDPDADAEAVAPVAAPANSLPNPRLLTDGRTRVRSNAAFPQIIQSGGAANLPPIQFNPTTTPPLVNVPPAIAFPSVDAATMEKARIELAKNPSLAPAPLGDVPPANAAVRVPATQVPSEGFIAPAPLIAATPITQTPVTPVPQTSVTPVLPNASVVVAPPMVVAPAVPAAPMATETLSTKSKTILSTIPSHLDTPKKEKGTRLSVDRISPKVDVNKGNDGTVDAYESQGIKMSVRRPGIDTNAELTHAYSEVTAGDAAGAIESYKRVLAADPLNQDALFSLASIYHRQGQIDKARPLYGILLKNYPNNRDGLNNFLVLISDESPQEALAELERLEQRNPDFSPIPAQEALLLNKLGYVVEARDKMIRAIEISPENLTYKYNLAVMFDSQGDYASAAAIYRDLLASGNSNGTLPISLDALQRRLNFIGTLPTPPVKQQ